MRAAALRRDELDASLGVAGLLSGAFGCKQWMTGRLVNGVVSKQGAAPMSTAAVKWFSRTFGDAGSGTCKGRRESGSGALLVIRPNRFPVLAHFGDVFLGERLHNIR